MALVAPDLRPRGAAELYDAALHLAARAQTPLTALALAGAAPAAVAGLALGYAAVHGRPTLALAAAFASLLMARGIAAGAASLAAEAAISSEPIDSGQALKRALARAPSLVAASGAGALIEWIALPATFFAGVVFWAPLLAGIPLVARGEAGPFSMGRLSRKRLAPSPARAVRMLHALATLVVGLNLHTGLWLALTLGRTLLGLDVAFLEELASLRNPVYPFFLAAMTLVLLEPVRLALGVVLLVDARVRSEGLDLTAAVERLSSRRGRGAAAALLFALAALGAPARAADRPDVERLAAMVRAAGLEGDARAQKALAKARALEGADAKALHHFVEAFEENLQAAAEEDDSASAADMAPRLGDALSEMTEASAPGPPAAQVRTQARAILSRGEFEAWDRKAQPEDSKEVDEDWPFRQLSRAAGWIVHKISDLLDRIGKWIRDRASSKADEPSRDLSQFMPGLGGGAFRAITYGLLGLAAVVALLVAARGLRRQVPSRAPAEPRPDGAGAPAAQAESALAREPMGWWSQADALAASGHFREALRSLYLAVLAAMHRRGAIDYDPARSNWDYVRAFKGEGSLLPSFKDLTLRFDFAWYGRRGDDALGYAAARSLAGALLEPEARGRA